jgi:hypothetical protein
MPVDSMLALSAQEIVVNNPHDLPVLVKDLNVFQSQLRKKVATRL